MIELHVPCGRPGEYLRATESSLVFRVSNSGVTGSTTNDAAFSGGAWSVIQKLSVFHGAALISEIDDYATLHQCLYNGTASAEYTTGVGNMLHGTANETADPGNTAKMLQGATIPAKNGSGANGEYYAALQLINPIVGTTAERAIPIGRHTQAEVVA